MPEKNNITFEIKEHLGVISNRDKGWNKELNIISWNGQAPKYDIREWDEYHERMSRGVTMFADEMKRMVNLYLADNNRRVVEDGRNSEEEKRRRIEEYRKLATENARREAEQTCEAAEAGVDGEPQEPESEAAACGAEADAFDRGETAQAEEV